MRFPVVCAEVWLRRRGKDALPRGGDRKPPRGRGGQSRYVARQGVHNAALPSRGCDLAPLSTQRGGENRMESPPDRGGAETRVRSRGLPSNRRMDRKGGIMTRAIRNLFVAGGAGERPAKSLLTSPVCALPVCSPWWRVVAHLADTYAKQCTQTPAMPEMVRVRVQKRGCPAATGPSCCGSSVGVVAASVNPFPSTRWAAS